MSDDQREKRVSEEIAADVPAPKKSKKKLAIVGVIVVVLVAVGAGMMVWHESPSFCSTMCHVEGTYVDNYMQNQAVAGKDKYGNDYYFCK
jgi:flagellar basal body-associated protein FliL